MYDGDFHRGIRTSCRGSLRTGRPDRLGRLLRTHSSQGILNCQLFIRKIYSPCKVQREDKTLSSFRRIISLSRIPSLLISHPISLPVPPSLTVSILRHFNNSKWYIKVNEICHTSGHYDACQGFVSSVRWTAAAHQQPVLLPHHVEYWISKVLENTVAPLISSRHSLQRLTPHAFISLYNIPLHIIRWGVGTSAGTSPHLFSYKFQTKHSLQSFQRYPEWLWRGPHAERSYTICMFSSFPGWPSPVLEGCRRLGSFCPTR